MIDEKLIIKTYRIDPRETPLYGLSQTANYLKISLETLKSWVRGRTYPRSKSGIQTASEPLIKLPDAAKPQLSFMNLVEIHVLSGIRLENVPLIKVRIALNYLEEKFPSPHPLADREFETDGVDLFFEHLGHFINVSQSGQLAMRETLRQHLRRIERDNINFKALRLYPFVKPIELRNFNKNAVYVEQPREIVIDPLVSFGKPRLVGTGITTEAVSQRFEAGESVNDLAEDYGISQNKVEEAIRYETCARKAA